MGSSVLSVADIDKAESVQNQNPNKMSKSARKARVWNVKALKKVLEGVYNCGSGEKDIANWVSLSL